MRRCASRKARGFTLLELTVAMASAAVLVALLVGAWMQAVRSAEQQGHEAAAGRTRLELRRTLQSMLDGAQWSLNSQMPQGALPWEQGDRGLVLWSREGLGRLPGPSRWWLRCDAEGLQANLEDPQSGGQTLRRWANVRRVRLECCRSETGLEGEQVRWVPLEGWDLAVPFRPVALRLWVEERDGSLWQVCTWA